MNNLHLSAQVVARHFEERYRIPPDVIWESPGRVNLMGDHTDYQGGFALPIAVPYATWIAAARTDGTTVRVATDYHDESVTLSETFRAAAVQSSGNLSGVGGFVTAVWDILGNPEGADLLLLTDLPVASGLSSSAALSVGLIAAVSSLAGEALPPASLIRMARRVENRYLGVDSGILDPMAIVLAEEGQALWVDAAREEGKTVPFAYAQAGACLWIIDTRAPRTLAGSGYQDRVRECAEAAEVLGVPWLKDADETMVARLPEGVLRRRARHVVSENARVRETVAAAAQGDWPRVSQLFWDSHESLATDFMVSTAQLDDTVRVLRGLGIGARLTGAGFGGSVIALGPSEQDGEVRTALQRLYQAKGWPAPGVMPVKRPARGLCQVH